jgi:type VI secretion system secreted protein Hcp
MVLGASNSAAHTWAAGGAGKVNMQDVSLTRYADGQSPLFFDAVARGQHLPTVVLVDGLVTITLTDVLISSYSTGGFAGRQGPQANVANREHYI